LVLLAPAVIRAQEATLVGTVADPSAAAVPGSTVVARHVETNRTFSAVTGPHGDYRIPLSRIGRYEVSAKQAGFKTTVISDLIVQIGQTVRLDLVVQLGEVAEVIQVEGTVPIISSETSSLAEVMDTRKIVELPLNGREFLELAALTPGVSSRNASAGSRSKGGALEVSGGRSGHNQFRIDGVDNTDNHYNEIAAVPPIDSIQEFQMVRNLYAAEYGRAGGGILDVRLRSGTNDIHGSVYEFHRNSALDARNFFAQSKPPFRFHQFGASVGGPILLPKIYDGRNRSFFFFNYEGFRESKGASDLWYMPTAAERQGDFSQSVIKPRNFVTNQPYPDNRIPRELWSPVGAKLIDMLPAPNASDPIRNFISDAQNTRHWNTAVTRVDHQFNQDQNLFFSLVVGRRRGIKPYISEQTAEANPQHGYAAALGYNHVFGPSTVWETRLGYTRLIDLIDNAYKRDFAAEIGWPLRQKGEDFWGGPRFNFNSPLGRVNYFGVNHSPFGRRNNSYNAVSSVTVNRGRHYLKAGVDVKRQESNWVLMGTRNFFLNTYTGSIWADLLMGLATSVEFMPDVNWMYLRRHLWGMYAQDDWKVSNRLTLNIGLRYDINSPYESRDKRMATFDIGTGQLVYPEGAPLSQQDLARLEFPYRVGGPATAHDTDWKSIGPRIGFAFRPLASNTFVLRGGYGIFFAPASAFVTAYTGFVPPWQARIALRGTPAAPLVIDTLTADQFTGPLRDTGSVLYVPFTREFRDLATRQWNFSLQKEIVRNLALEAAYVGSDQIHASGLVDGHYYARQFIGRTSYPGFGALTLRTSQFNMDYHALQVTVRKAYSFGLSLLGNYTWSKALNDQSGDDANSIPDFSDFRQIWGRADFDVRHIFNLSGIYDLPVGRNRAVLKQAHGVTNAVLGGWKLNYIVQANSGYPFNLSVSGASTLTRPNVLPGRDANLPASERTVDRWFDPSAFAAPASGFGNLGKNVMDGPGFFSVDLGIAKEFPLYSERHRLEFRTELFNAFNRPNFYFTSLFAPPFNVPGANKPNAVRDPRSIQFALKYIY
jgi:outer membrane receptor protein involved in Fe transport